MKTIRVFCAHRDKDSFEIVKHPDAHCPDGRTYLLTDGENFSISQTEDQMKKTIDRLVDRCNAAEDKLEELDKILNPKDYEDEY